VGCLTGFGLICELDIAGSVVLEWQEKQGFVLFVHCIFLACSVRAGIVQGSVILWIGYSWICGVRVGKFRGVC
jgi:hypothetical protein